MQNGWTELSDKYLVLNEKYDKMRTACHDLILAAESELTPNAQLACPELVYARGLLDMGDVPNEEE